MKYTKYRELEMQIYDLKRRIVKHEMSEVANNTALRNMVREEVERYLRENVQVQVRSEMKKDERYWYGKFIKRLESTLYGDEK